MSWEWELTDGVSLTQLFLGDPTNISFQGMQSFAASTVDLILQVHNAPATCGESECPGGSPERTDGKEKWVVLMRDNMWIPTLTCIIYVLFVHLGPRMITKPLPVKWVLQLWNLSLAIFSAVGSYHCMGALIANIQKYGVRYTCCQLPKEIDLQGTDLDIWISFFVLSKIAEFFDTVLKILLQKKFLFLHWYHHTMTAWLGWLSLAYDAAPGQWYAGLNYTVHAPMYTYFFLSSVMTKAQFKKYLVPVAPFITAIQIIQMVSFVVVNAMAFYYKYYSGFIEETTDNVCHIKMLNLHTNATVTVSYLILFSILFVDKYCRKKEPSKGGKVQ